MFMGFLCFALVVEALRYVSGQSPQRQRGAGSSPRGSPFILGPMGDQCRDFPNAAGDE